MTLPDLFIIGAPKAGTTALHAALATHPRLFMSRIKEPKFYLGDGLVPPRQAGPGDAHSQREWVWRRQDYEALFDGAAPGDLRGESTPFYLSDFRAHERIRAEVPDAKLIAILRDPVDRAYSNWAHLWADGLEPIGDFLEACEEETTRVAAGWGQFWQYTRLGRYGEQLQHLFTLFPREQVHVLRYKRLVDEPRETLNGICRFLGVAEDLVVEVPVENVSTFVDASLRNRTLQGLMRSGAAMGQFFPPQVWRKASVPLLVALKGRHRNRPELTAEDRQRLILSFEEDIRLLGAVTGQSFDDWLGHRVGGTYSLRRSWAPSGRVAS